MFFLSSTIGMKKDYSLNRKKNPSLQWASPNVSVITGPGSPLDMPLIVNFFIFFSLWTLMMNALQSVLTNQAGVEISIHCSPRKRYFLFFFDERAPSCAAASCCIPINRVLGRVCHSRRVSSSSSMTVLLPDEINVILIRKEGFFTILQPIKNVLRNGIAVDKFRK